MIRFFNAPFLTTSFVIVMTTTKYANTYMKILYVGTMTNYTQKNRVWALPYAFVIQRRNRRDKQNDMNLWRYPYGMV